MFRKIITKALPTSLRRAIAGACDRRRRFYDLAKTNARTRSTRSPFIQFYSSADNIGNYLPVLGIRRLLGFEPDTWCMHDRNVDFDFINKHYKGAILGGAGLLHKCFQPFWEIMAEKLSIPAIVWGIGGCFLDADKSSVVERSIAQRVFRRCDLINLRDDVTADYYALPNAHISPCPTIVYVAEFQPMSHRKGKVLFSSHQELVPPAETDAIRDVIRGAFGRHLQTDNFQTADCGLDDIIRRYYCRSEAVVTTRLHGAIIAYGLSIPYVGIARDEKLRAFHRLYGNGIMAETPKALESLIVEKLLGGCVERPPRTDLVVEYSRRVREWTASL